MLVLPALHDLLSQIVSPEKLHTTVLLTPTGELVCASSKPQRPKDEIRVIVGLSGEVWRETKDQGIGMVDSEVSIEFDSSAKIDTVVCALIVWENTCSTS